MSQFDELLAELNAASEEQNTLAKALPAKDGEDDEVIQAAAAEGDTDADEENPEDHEEPDGDEVADKKPMAKSVTAMVDGEQVEAIDATDLIKSLVERADKTDDVLAKALASTVSTIKAQGEMIKSQGNIIKSLSAEMKKISGQGTGRKTVLTVVEKPVAGEQTMAKSVQPDDVLAKALTAHRDGKISSHDVSRCEIAIQSGFGFPADVLSRI